MDFFDRQDQARRNTKRLVFLFALAVVAIIAAIYLAAVVLFVGLETQTDANMPFQALLDPMLALGVTTATLAVIGTGSLYKTLSLSRGGEVVARSLGGRPVDPNTDDLAERRLLNVVEEMALASGTPVPTVYLLEEEKGINAFAAGFTPGEAVIGVTRGCLDTLTRDELQGVLGHELSHILNGDMRLNLRLMGLLHGILVIALIGYWILRASPRTGGGRKKGNAGAILLFGIALLAIGWVGVFFGRLIKGGVSRQREFLADASSVQFTRNPQGLAGALKKIGGLEGGSKLTASPNAEAASHLFFANGMGKAFFRAMATHPPLEERIRRIDPAWDGVFPEVLPHREEQRAAPRHGPVAPLPVTPPGAAAVGAMLPAAVLAAGAGAAASGTGGPPSGAPPGPPPGPPPAPGTPGPEQAASPGAAGPARATRHHLALEPAAVTASAGRPTADHLAYAARLLAELPDSLVRGAREPASAPGVIYSLLLDREPEVRSQQLRLLEGSGDRQAAASARYFLADAQGCPPAGRLPLAELALPALKRLSSAQYDAFRETVEDLAAADQRLSPFELALQRLLLRHLEPNFHAAGPKPVRHASLAGLEKECSVLLSTLAHAGSESPQEEAAAFAAGARALGENGRDLALLPPEEDSLPVGEALEELALLAPKAKRPLLAACTAAISSDGLVTVDEGELLRAVADSLECPVPPLLPGQALAAAPAPLNAPPA